MTTPTIDLGPASPTPPTDTPLVDGGSLTASALDFLNDYTPLFLTAFLVTLLATPLVRRIAIAFGVIDHPDLQRKTHTMPVAYLGGVAVFCGVLVAIILSYHPSLGLSGAYEQIPLAVVIGMVAITVTGFADDVWGWDPRLKIAGQLVAAAALAIDQVGVNVATGVLQPLFGNPDETFLGLTALGLSNASVYYWVGTALIAIFVLGGCNAANLIDGLDGLLSGVVGIAAVGLLAISLLMAPQDDAARGLAYAAADEVRDQVAAYAQKHDRPPSDLETLVEEGYLDVMPAVPAGWQIGYRAATGRVSVTGRLMGGARIVLCLALLGAVLGFLPHNFNPASIFLGDCGSLLLGYLVIVIILMLGERGQTHLVFAGLIVFSIPIIDTILAIIRRKLAGVSMSAADDQHLHHQLKRSLGSVRRAVLALYALGAIFAIVGVTLAALVMTTELRVRVVYAAALVLFSFVGTIAVKAARRQQIIQGILQTPSARAATKAPAPSEAPGESSAPTAS